MSERPVLLDATRGGVAIVTLNRPHLDNTFNPEVIEALLDICDELRGADGVRCVILEGAGNSFSAGDDLSWARFEADYTREDHLEDARDLAKLFLAWLTSEEGIKVYCSFDADSVPTDPTGALGCTIAKGKPEPIDFSYSDARRQELLQALALSAH